MTAQEKYAEADKLEAQAKALREEAYAESQQEGRKRPLAERLRYAATSRCPCGAGLAYDPYAEGDPNSVFKLAQNGPSQWECSALLLGTADPNAQHTEPLPFAFYEIKSENQPSAHGATTRPTA